MNNRLSHSMIRTTLLTAFGLLLLPMVGWGQTPIACGQTVTGTISAPGQTNLYVFSGNAGEMVELLPVPISGSLCPAADLYDSGGNKIGGVGCEPYETRIPLSATGNYIIHVYDGGTNPSTKTGDYNLTLQFSTGRCGAPIACGQTITNTLGTVGEIDAYTFNGNAGDVVAMQVNGISSNLCAAVSLSDPSGNRIGTTSGSCNGTLSNLVLTNAGTYTVQVFAWQVLQANIGEYSLTVSCIATNHNSLVGHWTFDEGSGTTAHDSSGNGYDGTLSAQGASFVTGGVSGNALSVTQASNGFVDMGNVLAFTTNSFTTVAWIKTAPGYTTSNGGLVLSKHISAVYAGYFLDVNVTGGMGSTGKALFYFADGSPHWLTSTTTVTDGGWHQIVGVHDVSGTSRIYVDGTPAQDSTASSVVVSNDAHFMIGGLTVGSDPTGWFTGLVDDVQVYNQALSDTQVQYLYQHPGETIGQGQVVFCDDFESYTRGTFPNPPWVNSGNTEAYLDTNRSVSASQSLKLFGVLGGCWGALAHRQLPGGSPWVIEFQVANGSEPLSGCHTEYGGAMLNTGPSWTTSARYLIAFDVDNASGSNIIRGAWTNSPDDPSDGPNLGTFVSDTWYKVRIMYENLGDGTVHLSYWINDAFKGSYGYPAWPYENDLAYVSLAVGEGSAWFDDVCLQTAGSGCTPPPAGLVAWWPGDGNANDIISGNNGTLTNGAAFAAGEVGQAFSFSTNHAGVLVGNPTNLQVQDFTIEAWIQRGSTNSATDDPTAVDGNALLFSYGSQGYGLGMAGSIFGNGALLLTKVDVDGVSAGPAITDTNFHHVAVTKSGTSVVFYVDGSAYPVAAPYTDTFQFTTPAAIGGRGENLNGNNNDSFFGTIDEVSIYNRALSSNEVAAIYAAGSAGKCSTNCTATITTAALPSGGGTTTGGGTKICGTSVTVRATPNACYQFVNWTEGGTVVSTSANYAFTASANRVLVANFSQITYTISTSSSPSGGGTTSGGGTVTCGSSVTVCATPSSGYSFVNWTENGSQVSGSACYTFTANSNRSLAANFSQSTLTATIAIQASPSNGGTVSGGGTYSVGTQVQISAYANSGWTFTAWSDGGVQTHNITVPSGGATYTATFSTLTNGGSITVSVPVATNILGTVDGTVIVKSGQGIGFSVRYINTTGNPVGCLWDFGDGATTTDCQPTHVFTNCGPLDVSVTISAGTVSGRNGITVAVACPMDMASLKLKANFKRNGADNCAIKGTLSDLPAGFSIANATVALDVGDAIVDFQLNAKGRGANSNGNIKFSYNKKTGNWTYTGKLKGDMKGAWATYGLTSGTVINSAVKFPVLVMLQSGTLETFDAELPLSYSNRSGTSGTGTYRPVK